MLVDGVRAEDLDKEESDIREHHILDNHANMEIEQTKDYDESDNFEEL